jgi:cell division protein FtsN
MASEDETAVAGISTPSKPDMEEEKATEQTVADAVADVDAPAPQELREEQIENAVAFLAHPKVARPLSQLLTQTAPVHG